MIAEIKPVSRYLSVAKIAEAHPGFTEASLRWIIFNASSNGLSKSGAIIRVGRKVLIDEAPFLAWLKSQGKGNG